MPSSPSPIELATAFISLLPRPVNIDFKPEPYALPKLTPWLINSAAASGISEKADMVAPPSFDMACKDLTKAPIPEADKRLPSPVILLTDPSSVSIHRSNLFF